MPQESQEPPFFSVRVELIDGNAKVHVEGAGESSGGQFASILAAVAVTVEQAVQEVADLSGYPSFITAFEQQCEHLRRGNLVTRSGGSSIRTREVPNTEPPHEPDDHEYR